MKITAPNYELKPDIVILDSVAEEQLAKDPDAYKGVSLAKTYEYDYVFKTVKDSGGESRQRKTKCDYNIEKFLHDENVLQDVRYNDFAERLEILDGGKWVRLTDSHLLDIRSRLNDDDDFRTMTIDKASMKDYVLHCAEHANPAKDVLDGLSWDGVARIDTFFADHFGMELNAYTSECLRLMLLGVIVRIYIPGYKFDYMAILQGKQGYGKSTFLRKLGEVFGSDAFGEIGAAHIADRKTLGESAAGKVILEYTELEGMRKATAERLKAVISSQDDAYRATYSVLSESHPRKYIIAGTTNRPAYLSDPSGNRRYLPLRLERKYLLDSDTAAQLWAEAYEIYKTGKYSLVLSEDAEQLAEDARNSVTQADADDFEDDILDFLNNAMTPANTPISGVKPKTVIDALSYDRVTSVATEFGKLTYDKKREIVITILERHGWKYGAYREVYGTPTHGYKRPKASPNSEE